MATCTNPASEPPLFGFMSGRFATSDAADADAVVVTLFAGKPGGLVRGWYAGPASRRGSAHRHPYLAPSDNVIAQLAILRARDLAEELGCGVCLVDPDDLWPQLWGSLPAAQYADATAPYRDV